ncbi:peptide synthetase [Billgrantia endophytica]|uniref:Peptide synthetase n=1 Tax=Billgrantia endophytica TaxID=2033802 RepID=A0A2N7TZN9_9GAMM|nr:peptide synthetase [Halomonas endophytica]
MQAAYWMGRKIRDALGGVAAHLYAEFGTQAALDVERLSLAVERLFGMHPMLRLQLTEEGSPQVMEPGTAYALAVDDMRHLLPGDLAKRLTEKRHDKTHQRLPLDRGHAAELSVSLLPDTRARLHVDVDMIAADPSSFPVLMDDLARLYEAPSGRDAGPCLTYFDYLARLRRDRGLARQREQSRRWWRERMARIPPPPPLPWNGGGAVRSESLAVLLEARERKALEMAARRKGLTPTTLLLALFADVLGAALDVDRFRLNVPMFYRHPLGEGVERLIGDFSNLLLLGVVLTPGMSLGELGKRLADDMAQLLSHSAYSGVGVMRDMSRHHGGMQISPVVFTSGLGMPGGELFSPRVTRLFGKMEWVVSQGPMVALDAQVAPVDGGLLINWDVRLDAIPESWVRTTFNTYVARVRELARAPEHIGQAIAFGRSTSAGSNRRRQGKELPLTSLQQAYLLGRSEKLPLGGVAMQEFREYRGRIDPHVLRRRLASLVRRHAALRTRIDTRALTYRVSEEPMLNLDEVDLRGETWIAAWERIDAMRDDYTHQLFDPTYPPWHMRLFLLPATETVDRDESVLFVRFDALIVDGRSIAKLMAALFDGQDSPIASKGTAASLSVMSVRDRGEAARYWAMALQDVCGPPQLPWKRPLESLGVSRYRRQGRYLPRSELARLARLGASHSLFRNSLLTALILEVLSRWTCDAELCIGMPVALPGHPASIRNDSTFIALHYDAKRGTLLERARRIQADVLQGLDHLAFSGIDINRQLLKRNGGGVALPVVVTHGLDWPTLAPDAPVRWHGGLTQTPQMAMDIRLLADAQGNLQLGIDYAEKALAGELIRDLLSAIERAIGAVIRRGELILEAGDCLDAVSLHRSDGENESADPPWPFLAHLAERLFSGDEGRAALIHGERRVGYGELGDAVQRVMGGLRQHGIGEGCVVAICLPRSPEHLMLVLACALMGAIWVPVDAGAPLRRRRYLLDNCHPELTVAQSPIDGRRVVTPARLLEARPDPRPTTEALVARSDCEVPAYYLYTSGTTGKPKCVVLTNRATANVIAHTQTAWRIVSDDVLLSATPLHHDMAVFDIFGSLSAGATLVLPTAEEDKDAIHLNRLVREHGVTLWCSVPAILEMLLACRRDDSLRSLRLIAQGGDYIKPVIIDELRGLLPDAQLFSLGGPTETTIWSIWHEIGRDDLDVIPYGRPLPGNRYYVCNDAQGHCPVGVVGRIYTSGINLALGYLDEGEIRQTDFGTLVDERGRPVRAFRTGDLGRYRQDGTLIFAGRVNGYVKVRGVRLSLSDIENELSRHPAIRQLLAVDHVEGRTGETSLGALYVCVGDTPPSARELREFARGRLPESHVPARFVRVEALPLSANGKPDRQAARSILEAADEVSSTDVNTSASERVLSIYRQVLGKSGQEREHVGADFLTMGLRPSHLRTIAFRLGEEFGASLSMHQLLRCRTAEEVVRLMQHPSGGAMMVSPTQGMSVDEQGGDPWSR